MASFLAALCGRSKPLHVKLLWLFCLVLVIFLFHQYAINSNVVKNTDIDITGYHSLVIISPKPKPNITVTSADLSKASTKEPKPHYFFTLQDDKKTYFSRNEGNMCLKVGTFQNASGTCKCKAGWWGPYCSYPEAIQKDPEINWKDIKPREPPRRVIYAVPFNNEFDITEIRLHELGDVVDLFMFGESNFSSHGDPKPQRLLKALNSGFMKEYQHKMLYVFLDHFDPKGIHDGLVSEALQRNNIGQQGLKRQLIGTRPDDLFIITDADEIPKKEALLFLKNHEGYPEPFGFTFQPHYFTFYWKNSENSQVRGGCTMNMVHHVMRYNIFSIRSPIPNVDIRYSKLATTIKVRPWFMGGGREVTGWHCSSCSTPKGIRQKMMSAQNGDFPRWGDFPQKMNESYIRTLIILGLYFDENTQLLDSPIDRTDLPEYVVKNKQHFSYLLDKSYYGKPDLSLLEKTVKGHH